MFFGRALAFVALPFVAASVLFLFAALFGVLNFGTFPAIANIVATRLAGLTLGLPFGGHSLGAGVLLGDLRPRNGLWWVALAALAGVFALLVPERRAAAA